MKRHDYPGQGTEILALRNIDEKSDYKDKKT